MRPRSRTGERALEYTQCTEGGCDDGGEEEKHKRRRRRIAGAVRQGAKRAGKLFRVKTGNAGRGSNNAGQRLSINDSMACSTSSSGITAGKRAGGLELGALPRSG